jgi:ribosome-binding factor A
MHHRQERLGKLIREQLSDIMLRDLAFGGAVVTIISVTVTDKLDYARVKVSVWPSEKSSEALKTLQTARRDLQYALMKKIRIKTLPRVGFELDRGSENAAIIEKVLIEKDADPLKF